MLKLQNIQMNNSSIHSLWCRVFSDLIAPEKNNTGIMIQIINTNLSISMLNVGHTLEVTMEFMCTACFKHSGL